MGMDDQKLEEVEPQKAAEAIADAWAAVLMDLHDKRRSINRMANENEFGPDEESSDLIPEAGNDG